MKNLWDIRVQNNKKSMFTKKGILKAPPANPRREPPPANPWTYTSLRADLFLKLQKINKIQKNFDLEKFASVRLQKKTTIAL